MARQDSPRQLQVTGWGEVLGPDRWQATEAVGPRHSTEPPRDLMGRKTLDAEAGWGWVAEAVSETQRGFSPHCLWVVAHIRAETVPPDSGCRGGPHPCSAKPTCH